MALFRSVDIGLIKSISLVLASGKLVQQKMIFAVWPNYLSHQFVNWSRSNQTKDLSVMGKLYQQLDLHHGPLII